ILNELFKFAVEISEKQQGLLAQDYKTEVVQRADAIRRFRQMERQRGQVVLQRPPPCERLYRQGERQMGLHDGTSVWSAPVHIRGSYPFALRTGRWSGSTICWEARCAIRL